MNDYIVTQIDPEDTRSQEMVDRLLLAEGIRRDRNLDYTCAIFDEQQEIIATGSCFSDTLRCLAVSSSHQGEGLMNEIVSHLVQVQFERGNTHLFLYTKCSAADHFATLGFYEITRIDGQIVFMENKRTGFSDYLKKLEKDGDGNLWFQEDHGNQKDQKNYEDREKHVKCISRITSVVMNANPFTLGHQYLAEKAAAENDLVHLFMVSEDVSLIPFSARRQMIMTGTAHLPNIVYHESGSYIISDATFPSYFQKDSRAVIESHANLDLSVFVRIAHALGISSRYVGDEPLSLVTGIYNRIMSEKLPGCGIDCHVIPRKEAAHQVISASTVRQLIKDGKMEAIKPLVPPSTWQYFTSPEAAPVIEKIRSCGDVRHY